MTQETRFQRLVMVALWLVLKHMYDNGDRNFVMDTWWKDYQSFMKDTSE